MYLEKINGPEDLKKLSIAELKAAAEEIREGLFNRISKIGGHCAPNFGVVEIAAALHYVFNSPEDKIIFDVSHQVYPHKMLTGRAYGYLDETRFHEISGYSNPAESPHDHFVVGHTSTSVGLAAGLAKGRDLNGGKENIIAVIGDGSVSGGQALEGFDTAGEMDSNLIIVVNDNEQSIAEVHGGLYKNLAELRRTKGQAADNLFKAFGLDYVYLEEGNDIEKLIEAFQKVKDIDHPIVLHVHTQKGKGFKLAEENREAWHWCLPFDRSTGKQADIGENYPALSSSLILNKIKEDKSVVFVTAGVPGAVGFSQDKRAQAGTQYIDVGIAEELAVSMCSGIAKNGGKPIFGTTASFIQRTYDQLAQDVCINKSPVAVMLNFASVFGLNDVTHTGFYSISMLSNMPNLVYLAPTNKEEYLAMLEWSIDQNEHPVVISMPGNGIHHAQYEVCRDYGNIINKYQICEQGSEAAVLALGDFFQIGQETAEAIESRLGRKVTLINPRFASGTDKETLEALKKEHKCVITLEDGILEGGFGHKVSAYYSSSDMKVLNYGFDKIYYDRFNAAELLKERRIVPELIAEDVLKALGR